MKTKERKNKVEGREQVEEDREGLKQTDGRWGFQRRRT